MICAITRYNEFAGKDGRRWATVDYILQDGTTGKSIFPAGQFGVPVNPFMVPPTAFKHVVEFNERGRVVGLGKVEAK